MHRLSIVLTQHRRKVITLLVIFGILMSLSCSSKELAPDFTLPDSSGQQVTLTSELESHRGVVIVFYRGFF